MRSKEDMHLVGASKQVSQHGASADGKGGRDGVVGGARDD